MIIYLEGVDGSGKSTLADKIKDALQLNGYKVYRNAEYLISTSPRKPNRISHEKLFERLNKMAQSPYVYILDRGPVSDGIYRIFDGLKPIATLAEVLEWLSENRGYVFCIYCHSAQSEYFMNKRGDDNPYAINCHPLITKVYDTIIPISSSVGCIWQFYDWTSEVPFDFINLSHWVKDNYKFLSWCRKRRI